MNPLLDFSGLPRFADVNVEHIAPAIDVLISDARATLERIAADDRPATWDSVVAPQLAATERLDRAWRLVAHINAVVNTPALREAYNAGLANVTQLQAELRQDSRLQQRHAALRGSPEFAKLTPSQQRLIDNALRDFRLGGAGLPSGEKQRFRALREEQAALMAKFEENVLDATNAFALYIDDESKLAGLPADFVVNARDEAAADGRDGWKLSLHMPSYVPVMQYAQDRALREMMYRAFTTRCSELGDPELNNSSLIVRLLALRDEEARLLGFRNFAEVSLTPKMAKSPAAALDFLREIAARAKPHARDDMAALREFARTNLGVPELEAWDIEFTAEKLRESRYEFSSREVKEYFPEDRVLSGMFKVVETIFGLHIREVRVAAYHRDVRFFEIRELGGTLIGRFYLDLYARANKRSGAWMDVVIDRKRENGALQTPVAMLTCNFTRPVGTSRRSSRRTRCRRCSTSSATACTCS